MKAVAIQDAFDILPAIRAARERAGRLLVGLDFDGTLAAIVPRPDDAALVEGATPVLVRLGHRSDTVTAVITGRSIDDIRRRMGGADLHYAGNHGLELDGPAINWIHPGAEAGRDNIARIRILLEDVEKRWPEIIIEDKIVSLSVHFRTVHDPAEGDRIVAAVQAAVARAMEGVRITGGSHVVEIRPDVDWDKGTALTKLRETLGMADAPAIFVGDDVTDEDAFRVMRAETGDVGILVGRRRASITHASALLDEPADVVRFLEALAQ